MKLKIDFYKIFKIITRIKTVLSLNGLYTNRIYGNNSKF